MKTLGTIILILLAAGTLIYIIYRDAETDRRADTAHFGKEGRLVDIEFAICKALVTNIYCPIDLPDKITDDLKGLPEKRIEAVRHVYSQSREYKAYCDKMSIDKQRNKLLALYARARNILHDVQIIAGEGEIREQDKPFELAVTPGDMGLSNAANECYKVLLKKGMVKEVGKK